MPSFRLRCLAEGGQFSPSSLLAVLPTGSQPVWLDSSRPGRTTVIAWSPDRVDHGRLTPGKAENPIHRCCERMADEDWVFEDEWVKAPAGWFGFFAFECGRFFEKWPQVSADPAGFPDWSWARMRCMVVWESGQPPRWFWAEQIGVDHASHARCRTAEFAALRQKAEQWQSSDLAEVLPAAQPQPLICPEDFQDQVCRARAAIGRGEFFQVNLSHRLVGPAPTDARAFYAALRSSQPTHHSAYWEDDSGRSLLSWSPELFLQVDGARLTTRPIKGTAPRGRDLVQDRALAAALDASEKEVAELTMIVDMARNDLGRVAEVGSVEVRSSGEIEAFPTLFHRTATVEARWNPQRGLATLLAATFPPASVTGAPKVRALQAIAEYEREARGPYCGTLGYWTPGQDRGEFSVLIRTATVAAGTLSLRVGAGIVWDSDPVQEWEETLQKARCLQSRHEKASL